MDRRAFRRLSLCVAALLLAFASGRSLAQPAMPPDDNGRLERSKEPLPDAVRKSLDVTLAREEAAKKVGLRPTGSFPMPVCDRGLCGAVDRDGTLAVPFAYESVQPFFEGRALVRVRHRYSYLYGYVDDTGRVIARPQYAVAGRFTRGFAQVDVEGKSGLLDREGQVALWPQFGFAAPFTKDVFWVTEERTVIQGNTGRQVFSFDWPPIIVNGVSDTVIKSKGKWRLVDHSGSRIGPQEFLEIRIFDYGDTPLMWARTEAGWGLIKPDLTWQIEPKFEHGGVVHDGLAAIQQDGRWGFIDSAGRIVIEPRFEHVSLFSGPYAPAKMNNLAGLIDRTGQWVLEPQYDSIYASGGLVPTSWWNTMKDKKLGLLDDALRVLIAPQLSQSAAMCFDGRILGVIDRKWKVFAHDGTPEDAEGSCESLITGRAK